MFCPWEKVEENVQNNRQRSFKVKFRSDDDQIAVKPENYKSEKKRFIINYNQVQNVQF